MTPTSAFATSASHNAFASRTPNLPVLQQIRASAGSGKTYALTTAFLEYLALASNKEGGTGCLLPTGGTHAWPEILAVTFTNRAAAEMQERIIRRLKETALGLLSPDDPLARANTPWTSERACAWLSLILRRFGQLNVRTIDSLVHLIVRMAALDLQLPPDFTPVFASEEALAPLLDTMLEDARHSPVFARLLENACRQQLLHSRDYRGFMNGHLLRKQVLALVPTLLNLPDPFLAALADSDELGQKLTSLAANMRWRAECLTTALKMEQLQPRKDLLNALSKCQNPRDADLPIDSALLCKACLTDCLLKASPPPSASAKAVYVALCRATEELRTDGVLLRHALGIMPFVKLAHVLTAALPAYFRQEGSIPAAFMYTLAVKALSGEHGVSQAFCRMGTSLTHILIDEFQDTSREQWAALHPLVYEALSHGGSFTWVGDVKQAIYGWREGDAALFDEIPHDPDLNAVASLLAPVVLPTNRRSRAVVVRSNNDFFSRLATPATARAVLSALLPEATPPAVLEAAATKVQHSFAEAAQLECGLEGGHVRLIRVEGEDRDDLNQRVHSTLMDLMDDLAERRPWGDITVLVRSNNEAALVASWLMNGKIPVITENSFLLSEHPLIGQLVALLTFLDAPQNEVAFWSVLSGANLLLPLTGLCTAELEDWLMSLPSARKTRDVPLYISFQEAFPNIWSTYFAPFVSSAGLLTPYDTVQEVLAAYRVATRFSAEHAFLNRFLEVLHRAESQGYATITEFLRYWNKQGFNEKAPMPENLEAVRVMTMHKAKGLQFPVVIVPWHKYTARVDAVPQPARIGALSVLTKPSPALGTPYYEALADDAREALHLLYVAWTRPEDELYAFITRAPRSTNFANALDTLLANAPFSHELYVQGEPLCTKKAPHPSVLPETKPRVEPVQELSTPQETVPHKAPTPMDWLPHLRIFRAPLDKLAYTPERRGTFVHHCLTCLHLTGNAKADAERAVTHGLRTFPVLLRAPEMVEDDVIDSLAWYAALPEAAQWARFGAPEQQLIDAEGRLLRADNVVTTPTELTVVEYKTGQAHPQHENQLNAYITLLTHAQPLPVRGVLVYLDLRRVTHHHIPTHSAHSTP